MNRRAMASAVKAGRITWREHARRRLAERGFTADDVRAVLISGVVIESYPDARPFPSTLQLGLVGVRPLHVVAAFDATERRVYIITVYEPSPEKFEPDWRTRRPK